MRVLISLLRKVICLTDHVSGWYTGYGFLKRGNATCKWYYDIFSLKPRFSVNVKKSVLRPCHNLQSSGMEISSVDMTLNVPIKKIDWKDKREDQATVQGFLGEVTSFHKVTGCLASTAIAVLPTSLLYWAIERQQFRDLGTTGNWNSQIIKSMKIKAELKYW